MLDPEKGGTREKEGSPEFPSFTVIKGIDGSTPPSLLGERGAEGERGGVRTDMSMTYICFIPEKRPCIARVLGEDRSNVQKRRTEWWLAIKGG
mmetsp:Transcript_34344/g.67883  ORF Transcript_34344/g.67883 Transcript_34344/m.67883 type:complete len:93 (-) Transcript_34344:642-920(-)